VKNMRNRDGTGRKN